MLIYSSDVNKLVKECNLLAKNEDWWDDENSFKSLFWEVQQSEEGISNVLAHNDDQKVSI